MNMILIAWMKELKKNNKFSIIVKQRNTLILSLFLQIRETFKSRLNACVSRQGLTLMKSKKKCCLFRLAVRKGQKIRQK